MHLTGDSELIKLAAFHTQGVPGSSGVDASFVDAYSLCRMCSSFGDSVGLCSL